MNRTETTTVIIPAPFRYCFDGAKTAEMEVYDIDEILPGVMMGTVKIYRVGFHGRTFAVRKDEKNLWYISA